MEIYCYPKSVWWLRNNAKRHINPKKVFGAKFTTILWRSVNEGEGSTLTSLGSCSNDGKRLRRSVSVSFSPHVYFSRWFCVSLFNPPVWHWHVTQLFIFFSKTLAEIFMCLCSCFCSMCRLRLGLKHWWDGLGCAAVRGDLSALDGS